MIVGQREHTVVMLVARPSRLIFGALSLSYRENMNWYCEAGKTKLRNVMILNGERQCASF
jgi:hypothetical protein